MTTTSTTDNTIPLAGSDERIYPLGDGSVLTPATCATLLGVLASFVGIQPFSATALQRLSLLTLSISLCLGVATVQQASLENLQREVVRAAVPITLKPALRPSQAP
ncbi:hypothetical protein FBY03_13038 [Pseudomonas sp. SJZ079]|uniref:hypothetical protein n=1 Tax=Pseudomonas sp. SJZ079 TaxID=2572887 RepID=UPI001199BA30|nr:hypothetical protein [Pseudomonas sp. SJZ079]TWC29259.1 hypothetical protein FBY03_13038 [Pseudomonas sp. SJZ079]